MSGIPPDVSDDALYVLREGLQQAVASIEALNLSKGEVTVRFPKERCPPEKPTLILEVSGLFERPERTIAVRQELADRLAQVLQTFAHQKCGSAWDLIEVLIYPSFNPVSGFHRILSPKV